GLEVGQQPPNRLDIEDELVAVQIGVVDGFDEDGELGAGCLILDPLGEHLSGASSSFPQHASTVQRGWDKNAQRTTVAEERTGSMISDLRRTSDEISVGTAPGNLRRCLRVQAIRWVMPFCSPARGVSSWAWVPTSSRRARTSWEMPPTRCSASHSVRSVSKGPRSG